MDAGLLFLEIVIYPQQAMGMIARISSQKSAAKNPNPRYTQNVISSNENTLESVMIAAIRTGYHTESRNQRNIFTGRASFSFGYR